MERLPFGKTIRMPCMRKGLCAYPDEVILLGQDVLAKMATTAHGIPVVIEHPEVPITEESVKQIPIVGRVSAMDYVAASDEWYVDFVVDTKEAIDLLKSDYGVSTAWYGELYGPGGTLNNVPYDKELMGATYEHLAIVSKPRYEMATNPIFLNSKTEPCNMNMKPANIDTKQSTTPTGSKPMKFSLWRNKRDEIKVNEGDDVMVNMDGKDMKLCDMVDEYKKSKSPKEEPKKASKTLSEDDMVEIDGESMSVKDLIAALKGGRQDASAELNKPGEGAPEGFVAEGVDDKMGVAKAVGVEENAKDAADEDAKDEAKDEAKTNARFNSLKAKHENGAPEETEAWLSTHKRVELGKLRYGSPQTK